MNESNLDHIADNILDFDDQLATASITPPKPPSPEVQPDSASVLHSAPVFDLGVDSSEADSSAQRDRPSKGARAGASSKAVIRDLPHSLEAETNLLSCCLLDGADVVSRCIEGRICRASFYDPKHSIIFEMLLDLYNRQLPINVSVLAEELKGARQLDAVGGLGFLVQVSSLIPTTAQSSYFIEKVRELATRRDIMRHATAVVENSYNLSCDLTDIVAPLAKILESPDLAGQPAGKGYTLWAPSQFLAAVIDPDAQLVGDGLVTLGTTTSLVGAGGLGKTRLVVLMAVAQILGREWCGLATRGKPQRWLILSSENGISRWKHDLGRIFESLSTQESKLVEAHLQILALTPVEDGNMSLDNPATIGRLRITLKAASPGVLVIDPLADVVMGDESKTVDMVATLRALRSIIHSACPAAATILVHHARTGASNVMQAGDNFSAGNFARGAKALYSSVRAEIQLAPADRDDPSRLVLSCGKFNDGVKFSTRGLVFVAEKFAYEVDACFDVDAWRSDVAGKRKDSALTIVDVIETVKEIAPLPGDEATTKQVIDCVEATGASQRTVQRQLKAGVQQGYLRHGKKRGHWKLGAKPLPR